ncbi:bifunctional metallophosphatase/5'-nucleotidase [Vibrio porteresiae]|uniref:Bifunctional UDP-sugar hydrolase/5'-nucleotidase n=1 Tax=Vibrio porteresiae DSM 19223 TaxID=1123496 RepID=A0ABZ0QKQ8_9VIBR|nr:bifunctional UDP-sugar hydrolase/5'-nucleotidase [Vibrio porteresiae]WPC76006.1 bifunctional UDP-sugar hydrolase/5'-nucleotidase [Vibrio porteresiae DSM 19223]
MNNTDKTTSITLAHINDTHSYFEPTSLQLHLQIEGETLSPFVSAGGFARIATRVAQLRSDATRMQKEFLFVHAGDCFQGTLYFSLFKGKVNVDMLNALQIDAMALGNHELDMGNEPVARFAKRIQFPLLAGNWDLSNESPDKAHTLADNPLIKAYNSTAQCARWIVKGEGQDRVALFGVSIDKMADIANPDWDTPFINAVDVVKQTVQAIQASGINKIILISHLGYDQDLELAEKVDGIGVIVGGHSHVLQGDFSDLGLGKQDTYGQKVNDTYVVQAGYYALALGHCDIEFDQSGRVVRFQGQNELLLGRRLFLDASMNQAGLDQRYLTACDYLNQHPLVVVCKKDPDVHAVLCEKYMPQVREMQQQVVVQIPHSLRHVRIPDEHGPSQVAPLVARGFYEAMRKRGYPVQFAIHNAGGVRTSIQEGPLTTADIVGQLLPFAIPVGVYQVKGQVIAMLLEGAINNATNNGVDGTGSGSFPYTHHLQFEYHAHLPKGHRIRQLRIYENNQWQPVDAYRNYYGASSAYTIKGKEGYDAFSELTETPKMSNLTMADTFVELLTTNPKIIDKPVSYDFFSYQE